MKPETIEAVWAHGRVMPEADSARWRQDECGAWMYREHYGRENCEFGWKIEKVQPGEVDAPENLRPFHWRNGYDIGIARPHCRVVADRLNVPAKEYTTPPRNRER